MGKLIAWICICALLITLTPQLAFAANEPLTATGSSAIENGWRYKTDTQNTYAIVEKYAGDIPGDGIVTVPSELGGKPVKFLGYEILGGNLQPVSLFSAALQKEIKALNLPSSIAQISENALSGLSSLEEINIPDGTDFKSVDGVLFSKNNSPEQLLYYPASKTTTTYTIPATTIEIATEAFAGSKYLKQITIPATVTSIGDSLFKDSRSLERVVYENSLSTLPSRTFQGCQILTSVTFPAGLTEIGSSAFEGALSLETIKIPNSVRIIGDYAFKGCVSLNKISWEGNSTTAIGSFAFTETKALRSVTLPTGLTSIEEGTFRSSGLRTVKIPPSVTKIGPNAFSHCQDLTLVSLPSTKLEIWIGAFSYTPSLTGIDFDSTQSIVIDELAFASSGLERVNLTDKVSEVGANSFAVCKNLKNISIQSNIQYLPIGIFSSLAALEKVYIPETVVTIDDRAFAWNSSLTEVYFTGNAPSWGINGVNAFYGAAPGFKVYYPTGNTTFNLKDGKWKGYPAEEYSTDNLPGTYNLTLTAGSGGLIVGGVSGNYAPGEKITVRAQALPGYKFAGWSNTSGGNFENAYSPTTLFTMGSSNTNVSANFVSATSAEIPVFVQSPEGSVTVTKGQVPDVLRFPAEVSDGGTITYQWYRNTAKSNSGGTALAEATNISYLPSTSQTGTFYYYVVATNNNSEAPTTKTASATSSVIEVKVTDAINAAAPVIRDNISGSASYAKNATVPELKIFAYAPDYGQISYQWYKNTIAGTAGATAIEGATARSYTPPSDTQGTFYYYAVASNYNKFASGNQIASETSGIKTIIITSGNNNSSNTTPGGSTANPANTPKPVSTTIETKVEISNGIAKVTVNSNTLNTAIDKAFSDRGKSDAPIKITINATDSNETKVSDIKEFEFILPTASLKKLYEAGKAGELELKTPIATTSLDSKALEEICANSGTEVIFTVKLINNNELSDALKNTLKDSPVYDFTIKSQGKNITSLGKGRAKITLPYVLKNGEAWSNIVVNYVSNSGNLTVVKESKFIDTENTIKFITNHFSMYSIGSNPLTFTDINNQWYATPVDFVTSHGLFAGMGDGTFSPETTMTRGMFVTVLANLEGKASDSSYPNIFSDVDPVKYYAKPIAWAAANKIVSGVSQGKFAPDAKITREEMAVMLDSYIRYKGIYIDKTQMKPFDDIEVISPWAKKGVESLQSYRIIVGDNNKFAPKDNATRAQVAAIFLNYIDALLR